MTFHRRAAAAVVCVCLAFAVFDARADSTSYKKTLAKGAQARARLAKEYGSARDADAKRAVVSKARGEVNELITAEIIPAWFGTTWDFYGTSQTPKEGTIACGYFVSTVLRDAGFDVQRIKLAQQAAEKIVLTLSETDDIARLSRPTRESVVSTVTKSGDGLYVVGLDFHVGFLVKDGDRLDFCHSSYVDPPFAVVCQPASKDPGLESEYYVIGRILSDEMMVAWLTQEPIRVQ